jgi:hypothetical protein
MNRVEFNLINAELRGGIKALTNALVKNIQKLARDPLPNRTHEPNQAEMCPARSHLGPDTLLFVGYSTSEHVLICES